ncbi:uncharacterized protein LOC109542898 isoform X2 [Dendroctonus ponderosae]|uniref:uncharacterized protein LOC109542898 isoform X2 n=1 Tax=Dendroctonus ponderosae TaxID=77166 RepID=UPI002035B4EE|nr:uncharacterized protein LOC109542898 isoform X2 [Dendroctonus ponderosae]
MDKANFPRLTNNDFNIGGQASGILPSYNLDTSWPPFPDFCDDFFPRESLGILNADKLANNSLIDQSARESLGILNLSALDIGRDSIGLFSINNPIFQKQFKHAERTNARTFLNDVNSPRSSLSTFIGSTTEDRPSIISTFTSSLNPFNDAFVCDSLNTTHSINIKSEDAQTAFLGATDNNSNSIKSLPLSSDADSMQDMKAFSSAHHTFIKEIASDTNELDDSVFEADSFIAFESKDNLFNEGAYNLDLTSEPDWSQCDLTPSDDEGGTDITVCKAGNVPIQIDKLFGMKAAGLSDNVGVTNDDKVTDSSVNISQNISKISRASSGSSNILEMSPKDHSILKYINILSDLIGTKENLSQHQRTEGQRHLRVLADLFRDDEKKVCIQNSFLATATCTSSSSTSAAKPLKEARPLNNLTSQNKAISAANKFNKIKASAPLKKEPLRAILPVENMSKAKMIKKLNNSSTPEQKIAGSKNAFSLNKSSSSYQESKLKPLAASTPDSRLSNSYRKTDGKRSFSGSFSSSNISAVASEKTQTRKSLPKLGGAVLMRRNSDFAGDRKKDVQKLKRSNSTGRESKLSIALSKVRKNMLNSPHLSTVMRGFNSQGISQPTNLVSKYSTKFADNTVGKENMEPVTARQSK